MGYDPFEHATELGISVIYRRIRTANGLWLPDHNTIVLKEGMRAVHDRSTLAHELAHSVLGHADDRPKHEVQADRLAAENLLEFADVAEAIRWTPDVPRLAAELGVSGRLMQMYLNVHRHELAG